MAKPVTVFLWALAVLGLIAGSFILAHQLGLIHFGAGSDQAKVFKEIAERIKIQKEQEEVFREAVNKTFGPDDGASQLVNLAHEWNTNPKKLMQVASGENLQDSPFGTHNPENVASLGNAGTFDPDCFNERKLRYHEASCATQRHDAARNLQMRQMEEAKVHLKETLGEACYNTVIDFKEDLPVNRQWRCTPVNAVDVSGGQQVVCNNGFTFTYPGQIVEKLASSAFETGWRIFPQVIDIGESSSDVCTVYTAASSKGPARIVGFKHTNASLQPLQTNPNGQDQALQTSACKVVSRVKRQDSRFAINCASGAYYITKEENYLPDVFVVRLVSAGGKQVVRFYDAQNPDVLIGEADPEPEQK